MDDFHDMQAVFDRTGKFFDPEFKRFLIIPSRSPQSLVEAYPPGSSPPSAGAGIL